MPGAGSFSKACRGTDDRACLGARVQAPRGGCNRDLTKPRSDTVANTLPHVPPQLKALSRWIGWDEITETDHGTGVSKTTKKPRGSTKAVESCTDFKGALDLLERHSGVGLVFTGRVKIGGSWLVALDIDSCRYPETGEIADWAADLVESLESYTEISPSGYGLHIFVLTKTEPKALRKIPRFDEVATKTGKRPEIQLFGGGPAAAYVTVSGNPLDGYGDLASVDDIVNYLQVIYGATAEPEKAPLSTGTGPAPVFDLEKLAADETVGPLLRGTTPHGSRSEAYFALVCSLIRASNGHHDAVAEFLLDPHRCPLALDPKYGRPDWVHAEVARAAAKAEINPADVFEVLEPLPPQSPRAPEIGLYASYGDRLKEAGKQRWLLKGLLPAGTVGQVVGPPASGKTPLTMLMGFCVATGRDLLHHKNKAVGTVLYNVGEDITGVLMRHKALCHVHGVDPAKVPILFSRRRAALSAPGEAQKWIQGGATAVREYGLPSVALVVVDTQERNFGPGNENSAEDSGRYWNALDDMREAFRCSVISVHHTSLVNPDRGRGSTQQDGADEFMFAVRRDSNDRLAPWIHCTKMKNAPEPEPWRMSLIPVEVDVDEDGDPVTAITMQEYQGGSADLPGAVFENLENVTATESERVWWILRDRPMTAIELAKQMRWPRTTARRKLADLLGSYIEQDGEILTLTDEAREMHQDSMAESLRKFIGDGVKTTEEIRIALGKNRREIREILARNTAKGAIVRTNRGRYALYNESK